MFFINLFKPERMLKVYFVFYIDCLTDVVKAIRKAGCLHLTDIKKEMPNLKPLETWESRVMECINKLENLNSLFLRERLQLKERLLGPRHIPLKIISEFPELEEIEARIKTLENDFKELKSEKEKFEKELNKIEFELKDTGDFKRRSYLKNLIDENKRKIKNIDMKLKTLGKKANREILFYNDILKNMLITEKAMKNFGRTEYVCAVSGWIPQNDADKIERILKKSCDTSFFYDRKPYEDEEPPIKLKNPAFLKPFEILTTTYGYPAYRGIDPTPLVALSFTLMFGIMFADIGYGISLTLLSLVIYLATTKKDQVMHSLNLILMYAGISSFIFGFVFGEFFGGILKVTSYVGEIEKDISSLFILSLALGFVHISLSLISRIITEYKSRESLYPVSLLLILLSALFFYSGYTAAGFLIMIPGLVLLFYMKGFGSFEEVISLFTNILSYIRIGALASMHIIFTGIFTMIILSLPRTITGIITGAVLFLLGSAIILASSTFIVFIHSLRLHWVEFFRRFYSSMGERYKPFRQESYYVYEV
ncbi:MAG TPA: hypothetical protein ENH28_00995 [Euryarchaeota archaeon]|nr:V-type ATP synthase subunit I [archaeon BMS3Bbin15]HDL14729.1 hypothetical protein [Euryarchaeota archaeon]